MSKGQIEAEISKAIVEFEKEYMGRGPDETRTYFLDDMVVVRLHRVLTLAEKQLAKADESTKGRVLVKQVRTELLEKARPLLDRTISELANWLQDEQLSQESDNGKEAKMCSEKCFNSSLSWALVKLRLSDGVI